MTKLFSKIIRKITINEGYSAYIDHGYFLANFFDYCGQESINELDILLHFIESGLFKELGNALFKSTGSERSYRVQKIETQMIIKINLTEPTAEEFLKPFCDSVSQDIELLSEKRKREMNRQLHRDAQSSIITSPVQNRSNNKQKYSNNIQNKLRKSSSDSGKKIKPKVVIALCTIVAYIGCIFAILHLNHRNDYEMDLVWPERSTYRQTDGAPQATLNSIIDNPSIGDERNFVRIREAGSNKKYVDNITLEIGKTYEVIVYFVNDSNQTIATKEEGISEGTAVSVNMPRLIYAGVDPGHIFASVFASDTTPISVEDGVTIHCVENVYIKYVSDSAQFHSNGGLDGVKINANYLFNNGVYVGYNDQNGILPGGIDYSGSITFQFDVNALNESFGPDRDTFSVVNPASHVTFNSFIDSGIGDERKFVWIKDANTSELFHRKASLEPGKEYLVELYYSNNADSRMNDSGLGIANDVRISSYFTSSLKDGFYTPLIGEISSTNSEPLYIWDMINLSNECGHDLFLHCKKESLKIYNSGKLNESSLSDDLFMINGTYLGLDNFDGHIPGGSVGRVCFILQADDISANISQTVSVSNTDGASVSDIRANAGDEVTFLVQFYNSGTVPYTKGHLELELSDGLTFIPGSIKFYTSIDSNRQSLNDDFFKTGFYWDTIKADKKTFYISYRCKVNMDVVDSTITSTATLSYDTEFTKDYSDSSTASVLID